MMVQVVTCIHMLAAHEAAFCAMRFGFSGAAESIKRQLGAELRYGKLVDRFKLAEDPMEVRRRRTEVFQKSLGPALALARRLGLSLPGASLTERLLPGIMGIEES
jgi:3-hydroxyisobutyrate dehydrogenase-like beta-hydroxyacid dehydrogenase